MSYYKEEKPSKKKERFDRYRDCSILKDNETGELLLSTRDIDDIPIRNTDIYHKLKSVEVGRLDIVAYQYYKNPLLWWVIAQANDIYNPYTDTEVGMLLRVPTLETLYGYRGILL